MKKGFLRDEECVEGDEKPDPRKMIGYGEFRPARCEQRYIGHFHSILTLHVVLSTHASY